MPDKLPEETIESRIHVLRGKKVMIDRDLAALYQVETAQLKRAVRRNIDRFPEDFMFECHSPRDPRDLARGLAGELQVSFP